MVIVLGRSAAGPNSRLQGVQTGVAVAVAFGMVTACASTTCCVPGTLLNARGWQTTACHLFIVHKLRVG